MDIQIKSLKTMAKSLLSYRPEDCKIKEHKRKTGNAKMHYTATTKEEQWDNTLTIFHITQRNDSIKQDPKSLKALC
jgi:hypothetical protein